MLIRSLISRTIHNVSCITRINPVHDTIVQRLFEKRCRITFRPEERNYATYEGTGKTVGFVLNKKNSKVLMLDAVGVDGFMLSDGRHIVGSIIIFPHSLIAWHVLKPADVTEESLTLFKILEPKIDLLLFGYGSPHQYTPEIRQRFSAICKKLGLRYEALPTHQAAGLFNFLSDDRRYVAGAFIPPAVVDRLRFDRRKHLYLAAGTDDELLDEEEEQLAIEDGKSNQKLLK